MIIPTITIIAPKITIVKAPAHCGVCAESVDKAKTASHREVVEVLMMILVMTMRGPKTFVVRADMRDFFCMPGLSKMGEYSEKKTLNGLFWKSIFFAEPRCPL